MRVGFEPTDLLQPPVFKTGVIDQLYHLTILVGDKGLEPIVTFRFLLVRQAL